MPRSCAAEPKLNVWMITPPTRPWRTRSSSEADGVVPSMRTTSFWPIICASVGSAAVASIVRSGDCDAAAGPARTSAAQTTPRSAIFMRRV